MQRLHVVRWCGKILLNVLGVFGARAPDVSQLAAFNPAAARALDHPILERELHGRIFGPRGYASTPAVSQKLAG